MDISSLDPGAFFSNGGGGISGLLATRSSAGMETESATAVGRTNGALRIPLVDISRRCRIRVGVLGGALPALMLRGCNCKGLGRLRDEDPLRGSYFRV